MRKKVICLVLIGFLAGIGIGLLIPWAFNGGESLFGSEYTARHGGMPWAAVLHILVSGLYGSACMGGVALYDIERWSIARATAVHYALVAGLFVPVSLLMGWVDGVGELFVFEGIQLAGFFIIWLVMYLRCKALVRELNKMQRENNKQEGGNEK